MRKKMAMFAFMAVAVAFSLFFGAGAWGQATTSLRGTVTDSSGAAVPNAKVTLTNTATSVSRETMTTRTGAYSFPSVLPGPYKLTVESQGFETYEQTGLQLEVNLPATADVKLQVGGVNQTVEVRGKTPVLNQTNASLGQTMGTDAIQNLPLSEENTTLLLSLQPGVAYNGENLLTDDYDTRAGSVNGERSDQNNITLDGVSNNNEFAGYAFNGVLPTSQFSVEEFRVTTSNYGATEGRSSGAQIAMVTKGGTNKFHGSLYEFDRNTLGEANDYFLKSTEAANGEPNVPEHLVWNNYGGTIGGPILKNRLFFFFNYEGHRQAVDESEEQAIPSATLRDGIIEYACAGTSTQTPAQQCPAGNVTGISGTSYPVATGYYGLNATQLAGMDPLHIGPSAVALKYFNTYPEPNDPNYSDAPNFEGYRFAAPTLTKDNWYIGRIDYKLTANGDHTIFVRGEGVDDKINDTPFLPGLPPQDTNADLAKGFVAGYTGVFGPNLVNNFRYGLTRDSFGLNGDTNQPWVEMRDLSQPITYSYGDTAPVHNIADTLNWQKGAHNFQFGENFLLSRLNTWNTTNSFSNALTNSDWVIGSGFASPNDALNPAYGCGTTPPGPCYPGVAGGFDEAYDFPLAAMMGMATEVDAVYNYSITSQTAANPLSQGAPLYRHWATDNYNLFFQDTWQARRNLSVTYGINYQLMTPMTETDGQEVTPSVDMGSWFNQRGQDMAKGIPDNQVMGGTPISFAPAGSFYGKSGLYNAQTKNFAPRIGLAWTPESSMGWLQRLMGQDKTVIRAGFGMYFDNFGPELAQSYSASGEFGLSTVLENPAGTETIQCAARITSMNVIPTTDNCGNTIMEPAPPSTFPVTYPLGSEAIANGIDQSLRTPYSYAADLSVQRELPGQMVLDVAYVGHFAHRLMVLDDVATPMDLTDPKTGIDYFTAAKQLSTLWRQGVPESSIDSAIGATGQYWQDMLTPQSSYSLCSANFFGINGPGQSTTDLLQAVYDVFGPGCGNLYNETSALYLMDVAGLPTQPATGLNSYFNSQYSSLWDWRSIGWSNYNALQVSLKKQMSNGLLFGVNYTYSHSLDIESEAERGVQYLTDSIINPWSPQQMYGSSDFDLRHQINGYWVANLPFGQGRRFGSNMNGWENAILGGWSLSGTARWTSGFPFSVFAGYVWPTNWDEMGWADLTGSPIKTGTESAATGVPNLFTNPENCTSTSVLCAANGFTYAYPGQSGARNSIRGDGYAGWDMNLAKNWRIPRVENQSIQARWSVFNVLNMNRFNVYSMQDNLSVSSTFGNYTSTLTNPRVMELALIYQF
ncbi:MAG: carboxypeptidase-like regulatory domain-containing protein [Candidatus Acidiferrales bacterium]